MSQDDKQWFLFSSKSNQQLGPLGLESAQKQYGDISVIDRVNWFFWYEGMADWKPLIEARSELRSIPSPPPLPIPKAKPSSQFVDRRQNEERRQLKGNETVQKQQIEVEPEKIQNKIQAHQETQQGEFDINEQTQEKTTFTGMGYVVDKSGTIKRGQIKLRGKNNNVFVENKEKEYDPVDQDSQAFVKDSKYAPKKKVS